MTAYVKVAGHWKTVNIDTDSVSNQYVKVSGSWKTVTDTYVKTGGKWHKVFHYSAYVVPNIVNTNYLAAQTAITGSGNTLGTVTSLGNSQGATLLNNGLVASQTLAAGIYTTPQTIGFSYYAHITYTVPNVLGQTLANARAAITTAGQLNGTSTALGNSQGATYNNNGQVASQTPAAGNYETQQTVALNYYNFTAYNVPNVVGQTLANAESLITASSNTYAIGATVTSGATPSNNGTVSSQNPVANATTNPYSTPQNVTLNYYQYTWVAPNVVGMTTANAHTQITASNNSYVDGAAYGDASGATLANSGTVAAQNVTGGSTTTSGPFLITLNSYQYTYPAPTAPSVSGSNFGSYPSWVQSWSWSGAQNAQSYEVGYNTTGSAPSSGTPVSATSYSTGINTPGTWYFFVRTVGLDGVTRSSWSSATLVLPGQPTGSAATNGGGVTVTVYLGTGDSSVTVTSNFGTGTATYSGQVLSFAGPWAYSTNYTFTLTPNGGGPVGSCSLTTPTPPTPPSAPSGFYSYNNGLPHGGTIYWSPSTGSDGTITYYFTTYRQSGALYTSGSTTGTQIAFGGTDPAFRVVMYASDANGSSSTVSYTAVAFT